MAMASSVDQSDVDKLFDFPGLRARSLVWKYFGFLKKCDGPATKENL